MKNDYEIRGDVTALFLRRKDGIIEAIIDTEDLEKVKSFPNRWKILDSKLNYVGQQQTINGKVVAFMLHKIILGVPRGRKPFVDHRNNDALDNRKRNLRKCTHKQNAQNRKGAFSHNKSSKLRGVTWDKSKKRWKAYVEVDGKQVFQRYFKTIEEANKAVKKARAYLMPFSKEASIKAKIRKRKKVS